MKGFHFPSTRTTNSVRLILGLQYSLAENYIKRACLLWGLKQVLVTQQSDHPENQIWHTDEAGASLACYQSTLISGTSFFSQLYFPLSGRSTNEILWEIVASSPFLCPSQLRRSLARSRETRFARPNRRACSQARVNAILRTSLKQQEYLQNTEWPWSLVIRVRNMSQSSFGSVSLV